MVFLPPLADASDVEDLWRPLTTDETARVTRLILKASAMLRQRAPWVDDRIGLFEADQKNPAGLDPVTVASVVATIVKRFLSNVQGVVSEGVGPYSVTYAIRGEKDIRGEMYVSDGDLDRLKVPTTAVSRVATLKMRPRLAPWPDGDMGAPDVAGSGSADAWLADQGGTPGEFPWLDGSTDPGL